MAVNLGPPNWRGDIKWEEIPVQPNAPLPSSTLQSYFHPRFPFFSFLLLPGAASQPSRSLISVSLVDSLVEVYAALSSLHHLLKRIRLSPRCSVRRLLLPSSPPQKEESEAGATACVRPDEQNPGGDLPFL